MTKPVNTIINACKHFKKLQKPAAQTRLNFVAEVQTALSAVASPMEQRLGQLPNTKMSILDLHTTFNAYGYTCSHLMIQYALHRHVHGRFPRSKRPVATPLITYVALQKYKKTLVQDSPKLAYCPRTGLRFICTLE